MNTLTADSQRSIRVPRAAWLIILVLFVAAAGVLAYRWTTDNGEVLDDSLMVPLNGAATAKIDIDAGDGNLVIDKLGGMEKVLASGTLQYFEKQGVPTQSVNLENSRTELALRGGEGEQSWLRLPWSACNGATEWQIHLNPEVASDITAHSDGGNIVLNLAGMIATRVSADTGGGNIDVVLPDNATNLNVTARTGAGNVALHIPAGFAARIHASTGIGEVIVDPSFSKVDNSTYQSPDYDSSANRIDITISSGAGNVSVTTI